MPLRHGNKETRLLGYRGMFAKQIENLAEPSTGPPSTYELSREPGIDLEVNSFFHADKRPDPQQVDLFTKLTADVCIRFLVPCYPRSIVVIPSSYTRLSLYIRLQQWLQQTNHTLAS